MDAESVRKTVTFSIHGMEPPSHNPFYARMHWAKRAQLAKGWHEIVQIAMRENGIKKMLLTDCRITITAKMSSDLIDSDNLSAKLMIDGMKRYQTSRKKAAKFSKTGLKSKILNKIKMKGLENERYLFQDDCWPFVVSTTTIVEPASCDEIKIMVDGLPDR